MDDFVFRILCERLYDHLYGDVPMLLGDAERLEKLLMAEFNKNPVSRKYRVTMGYASYLAERWENFISC